MGFEDWNDSFSLGTQFGQNEQDDLEKSENEESKSPKSKEEEEEKVKEVAQEDFKGGDGKLRIF